MAARQVLAWWVSLNLLYGPNSPIVGSDCFAKANTVIAAGANTGVGILDMRGWSSGCTAQHDLFDANGTLSTNKPVKILWPATTVAICQPMITPASHFVMEATYNTQSVGFSGTLIKAGTAADGCAGNFPNGGATMTWTYPHPPFPVAGGAASGAYVALIYDGAQANNAARQTLNWKQQSFASNWKRFTFDCNGLCDFHLVQRFKRRAYDCRPDDCAQLPLGRALRGSPRK